MKSRTILRGLILGTAIMSLLALAGTASAATKAIWHPLDTKVIAPTPKGITAYHVDSLDSPCISRTVIGSSGVKTFGCPAATINRTITLLEACFPAKSGMLRFRTTYLARWSERVVLEFESKARPAQWKQTATGGWIKGLPLSRTTVAC